MSKVINKREIFTLISGVGVALFLSVPIFFSIPAWAKFVMLSIAAYVIYLTLRLAWIMARPADTTVLLKGRATMAQSKGVCCVCGKNRPGHWTLNVGYRKPTPRALRFQIVDSVLIGEGLEDGIHLSVPICEKCAAKYRLLSKLRIFAPAGLDPSFRVLKKKPGYFRGLRYPFGPSNIKTA